MTKNELKIYLKEQIKNNRIRRALRYGLFRCAYPIDFCILRVNTQYNVVIYTLGGITHALHFCRRLRRWETHNEKMIISCHCIHSTDKAFLKLSTPK